LVLSLIRQIVLGDKRMKRTNTKALMPPSVAQAIDESPSSKWTHAERMACIKASWKTIQRAEQGSTTKAYYQIGKIVDDVAKSGDFGEYNSFREWRESLKIPAYTLSRARSMLSVFKSAEEAAGHTLRQVAEVTRQKKMEEGFRVKPKRGEGDDPADVHVKKISASMTFLETWLKHAKPDDKEKIISRIEVIIERIQLTISAAECLAL
jgi:hypothetical protein